MEKQMGAAVEQKPAAPVCMKYGDYSYLLDKTKGHVGQYYVDKFRVAADFIKGVPASDADAFLGRDAKGAVLVPKEGIPQEIDPILGGRDESAPEDPRVAESEGAVYPWDRNYKDPKFDASTYADTDDEEVVENAFQAFRASVSSERGASLTSFDFATQIKVKKLKGGLSERYMLSLDGQLDREYARLQKIADMPFLNPTGMPQTEIPGTPYAGSVGALDFQKKTGEDIAFWAQEEATAPYQRPPGADAPELPYNTNPSLGEMKAAQAAAGILPASQ